MIEIITSGEYLPQQKIVEYYEVLPILNQFIIRSLPEIS